MQDVPYGFCHCGCGQKTKVATATRSNRSWIKGQPHHFLHGHVKQRPFAERFWEKVDKSAGPDGCWLWTRGLDRGGYGRFTFKVDGRTAARLAHRTAYELSKGPIPEGLHLDHLCRVPNCVNPLHLEAVTQRENNARSNGITAQNSRRTHCCQGHAFDAENTYVDPNGHRYCRTCRRESMRRHRRRLSSVGGVQAEVPGDQGNEDGDQDGR